MNDQTTLKFKFHRAFEIKYTCGHQFGLTIALIELDFVNTSIFVFWVKLNFEIFLIFIAPRSNWKIGTKLALNRKDTKSIHKNYNNTLKI